MAHWFPTSAFPSRSPRFGSFKVWPAAYFFTPRMNKREKRYMLVEGTDGKVHLIYHTDGIEEARKQGKVAVDNFIRIEKRFAHGDLSCMLTILGMRLCSFRILRTSFEKLSSYFAMVFRMSSQYGADGSDNTKRSYKPSYTTRQT